MTPYDQLSTEARQKRLEYLREWRRRNPDKVKKYTVQYWNRKADRERTTNEGGND